MHVEVAHSISPGRNGERPREMHAAKAVTAGPPWVHTCSTCLATIDEARLIQDSLLPSGTLTGNSFEVAYRFSPLDEVGGDFADFCHLPDGLVGLYIGDVVGKGLPAAMYAALVMGTMRGLHKTGRDTAAVLEFLNDRLQVRPNRCRFSCTTYALYDPASGELAFSNAGMPLPLLVSAEGCRWLGAGGFPSGMFPGSSYEVYRARLAPGDAVLFATDGLHEMWNEQGVELSSHDFGAIWQQCWSKSADSSLDFLFGAVGELTGNCDPHDDITAVVLKSLAPSSADSVDNAPIGR
jgi:sigma-B regulation protein RsbU (phosphoserine phosphatase)